MANRRENEQDLEQTALTVAMIDERGALVSGTLLEQAGQAANRAAARHVFDAYRDRKAANTIRRQQAGLALFAEYLDDVAGIETGDLFADPAAWRGVTWGLVQGFVKWQLDHGYAVGSVNVRLSTVKTYARLAAKAGTLEPTEYALIRAVEGYRHGEVKRIDKKRDGAGLDTRIGDKKAEAVMLTRDQARQLKEQPDTPQGRRDRLLLCILLDHGLRCGELAGLTVGAFDLQAGTMSFSREKVGKRQTHTLSSDTLAAARAWFATDAPQDPGAPLLRGSQRDGTLSEAGMTTRAITARVRVLGVDVGLADQDGKGTLSAHDLRHFWATQAARAGTPLDRLMDAGGWSSPAMPLRYIEAAAVANEGVVLSY